MKINPLLERIKSGQVIVADGATGTNLLARGLPRGSSPETWVIEQPEQIIRLHRDFIIAGADLILTCTFGATSLRLVGSSLENRVVEVNMRAVAVARQAAQGTPTLIAGSLGPVGKLLKPLGPVTEEDAQAVYAEQAKALSDAGADLLVIETQFDLKEASAAIHGALSASTLPLVCSFSYDRGKRTMMGVSPSKAVQVLAELGVDVIGINCGRSLEDNLQNLVELRQATALPIWFKPNAGLPKVDEQGKVIYDLTPRSMGALVPEWLAAGANIIGGCCGTSPEHLRHIALAVKHGQYQQDM